MICNNTDRLQDIVVSGWIRRTEVDQVLKNKIETATPLKRVLLYKEAGLWYETIFNLAKLRRSQPNEPNLAAAWEELLKSAGLSIILDGE
ncbi:MAG: DUF928 domain-containing protein [Symploca sp. SIO2B6]|nr:DUF928 domain-containing protein [Symploca sp. SIO2B6]